VAQKASSIPYRTLSKHTSSYAFSFLSQPTYFPAHTFFFIVVGRLTFFFGRINKNNTNKLFEEYDVQKNLDTLHQVVTEARERRQRSEPPGGDKDLWRADLQPRAAVRAQAIPALERERDALRARLADVRPPFFFHFISEFFFPCREEPSHAEP